jgi:Spy/CpxP family protein refolding chaperone
MTRTGMVAAVAVLVAAVAGAAEQGPAGGTRGGDERALRDEVYEVVDAYILMKAQERLGLTDEQFAKLVPLIRKQKADRRDYDRRRYRALGEMRRLFMKGEATEDRIAELLRETKAVEAELPAAMARNQEAIDAVLSPVQQAKYRVLDAEVDRRLHDLRQRAHERRREHGAGPDRTASPKPELAPGP